MNKLPKRTASKKIGAKSIAVASSTLYSSTRKQEIRALLAELAVNPSYFLTLGGKDLKCAVKFYLRYPKCQVVSLEIDEGIHQIQRKRMDKEYKNYRILPLLSSFSDFLEDHISIFPPFDAAFLDFNCIWSKHLEDNLMKFFTYLEKGALIGLTIVGAHDDETKLADTILFNSVCASRYKLYRSDRGQAIASTVNALAMRVGKNIKELGEYRSKYRNDRATEHQMNVSMWFFVFKML